MPPSFIFLVHWILGSPSEEVVWATATAGLVDRSQWGFLVALSSSPICWVSLVRPFCSTLACVPSLRPFPCWVGGFCVCSASSFIFLISGWDLWSFSNALWVDMPWFWVVSWHPSSLYVPIKKGLSPIEMEISFGEGVGCYCSEAAMLGRGCSGIVLQLVWSLLLKKLCYLPIEVGVVSMLLEFGNTLGGLVSSMWALGASTNGFLLRAFSLTTQSHGSLLEVLCFPMEVEWLLGVWVVKEFFGASSHGLEDLSLEAGDFLVARSFLSSYFLYSPIEVENAGELGWMDAFLIGPLFQLKVVEAIISDCGLEKLVDARKTHVTTQVCGIMGLIALEYGRSSKRIDVFGYGITLLELVIG
ncbi:hypothetical protein SUGI_1057220 [Cryptomeria japonica]|nr:hypothetical protein SUGI_1057220 [Cryptomeria japonica]